MKPPPITHQLLLVLAKSGSSYTSRPAVGKALAAAGMPCSSSLLSHHAARLVSRGLLTLRLIQREGSPNGVESQYRMTAKGQRVLKQAKAFYARL